MRRKSWMRWAVSLGMGAALLQTTACQDNLAFVNTIATLATTGGVLYLVSRVVNN